ncbi:Metallo-beta-lactamase superfamily [Popillia japonica]|uniref:hydroxyacylglutathione hydrolase n=1 Tax=Popillia japonica TaxID=7064 RepID=A0AAW1K142_POPJA
MNFARQISGGIQRAVIATYFKVNAIRNNGLHGSHSKQSTINFEKMKVIILPALADNYMYLIVDENTKQAAVVDPVEPETVMKEVEKQGVNLSKVLTTHHHWDHASGNQKLLTMVKKSNSVLQVYGGDERIGGLTDKVQHGDKFMIGDINVECLFTPCHTTGHICYYLTVAEQTPAVFTGDTLFVAGCGRFFEGTAEQMHSALIDKLGNLPDSTQVYCGHEYTLQNLKFAQRVEPNNTDISDKIKWAEQRRKEEIPTVPSTIGDEKKINPFMRVGCPAVQKHAGCGEAIATMHAIRKEKDSFKAHL